MVFLQQRIPSMHAGAILRGDCLYKRVESQLFVLPGTCNSQLFPKFFAFTCPVISIKMVRLSASLAVLPLVASAAAQQLNTWPKKNYGDNGRATDNDINTTEEYKIPASFALLFNSWIKLSGFYIQSSGDFITDYEVKALIGDFGRPQRLVVGKVCGATGNFTFVPLINPQDGSPVWSDTLFIDVSASKGNSSSAVINEIWPVFPGDDVFDPGNTSPCPVTTRH